MPIPLALLAAAGSFAAKQVGNAINQGRNERNMALQNDYWERQVNYLEQKNDPARQADKWRRAGISPQAVFGSSPGGAGLATDSSAPNSDLVNDSASDYGFVRTLAEKTRLENESRVADATVDKLNAEADKLRGDTKDPELSYRQQKLEFDWTLVKKEREEIQKSIDEIDRDYAVAMKQADLSIKQQILFETLAKIDKLLADTEVSKQMKENLKSQKALVESQKALVEAQTKTEGSKQRNLDSSSDLNDSERRTVDALRDGQVKLTDRQADQVLREIGLSEARTLNEYEDLVKAMTGTAPATSLWMYVDRLIARIDSEKGGYANADELRRKLASSLLSFYDEND